MVDDIFWNPKEGESIEGILIDKLSDVGEYKSMLYKVKVDDKIYCIWGKVQLDSIMNSTSVGDIILLKYVGFDKINNNMKRYELEILNE